MNPYSGLRGLPRDIWVLFATALVNRVGTMALPFLALYLTRARGWTGDQAGLALSVFGLGSLVTAPLAGRLADRVGAGRVLQASLILSGFLMAAVPWARGFWPTLAVVFLWAVVGEAYRPANMALLAQVATPEQRKSAYALHRLALNLGMSVGPALGGVLATWSYASLFWLDGATALLAGLVGALLLSRSASRPSAPGGEGEAHVPPTGFRDLRFLAFLALLLPVSLVFFQLTGALPLYLVRDLGLSEASFGLLFSLNTLLVVVVEIPLTGATARWSHGRTLPLGALLVGAGFAATGLASGFWGAAASVVVWTFGEMVLFPACNAAAGDLAPAGRRGEYMGLFSAVFSLALAAGPLLGTRILEDQGPGVLWGGCAVLGGVSAAGLAALWRGPRRGPAEGSG